MVVKFSLPTVKWFLQTIENRDRLSVYINFYNSIPQELYGFNPDKMEKLVYTMVNILQDFGELVWILLPLMATQIVLIVIGLWEWNRKKEFLGQNKIIWLLIIIFINFIGPIIFLIYSQKTSVSVTAVGPEIDDWEV